MLKSGKIKNFPGSLQTTCIAHTIGAGREWERKRKVFVELKLGATRRNSRRLEGNELHRMGKYGEDNVREPACDRLVARPSIIRGSEHHG